MVEDSITSLRKAQRMRLPIRTAAAIAGCAALLGVKLFLLILLSFSWCFGQTGCSDSAARGHLNVMTINLLFSEIADRQARLENIANFLAWQMEEGDPVDVILLQEVVGGWLVGTVNSSFDLKVLLAERGLHYNLRYRITSGLPGTFEVGNAILSRCEILSDWSHPLPFVFEGPFEGIFIPLGRTVIMSAVNVPPLGSINIFNTHLCSFCSSEDRLMQTEVLLQVIETVEDCMWGKGLP